MDSENIDELTSLMGAAQQGDAGVSEGADHCGS